MNSTLPNSGGQYSEARSMPATEMANVLLSGTYNFRLGRNYKIFIHQNVGDFLYMCAVGSKMFQEN